MCVGGVIGHPSSGGTDSEESGTEESDSAGEGQESDSTGQGEGEEGQGEGQGEGDGDGSGASRDGSGGDLEEVSMETDMPAAGGGLEQVSRVPSVFVQLRRPEEVQVSVGSGATHLAALQQEIHYRGRCWQQPPAFPAIVACVVDHCSLHIAHILGIPQCLLEAG